MWIGFVCSMKTMPGELNGIKTCVNKSRLFDLMCRICVAHYVICNFIVVSIIFYYNEKMTELLPNLKPQFLIIKRFMPLMFASTTIVCFSLFIIKFTLRNLNEVFTNIGWCLIFTDSILNNVIMHYTIFAHVSHMNEENRVKAAVEYLEMTSGIDLDNDVDGGRDYWVAMPGLQPIKVSEDLVKQFDMWEHVVTDHNVMLQIERFKKMSCYSTLYWVCRTEDELLRMIEMFE